MHLFPSSMPCCLSTPCWPQEQKILGKLSGKCSNSNQRACLELREAVANLADQTELARISIHEPDQDTRSVAVGRLTEQGLLAKVAVETFDRNVWQAAIQKLTDQTLLAKIVLPNVCLENTRLSLYSRKPIASVAPATPCDAGWDPRLEVALAAVRKIADQGLLAKIAAHGFYLDVRVGAVEELTDQAALGKIAVEAGDADVRKAAQAKLTDQAALAEIATEGKDSTTRRGAVSNLTDLGGASESRRRGQGQGC